MFLNALEISVKNVGFSLIIKSGLEIIQKIPTFTMQSMHVLVILLSRFYE